MQPLESRQPEIRRLAQAALSAVFAVLLSGCAYVPGTASPIKQYQQRLSQQKALNRAADAAALDSPAAEKASFDEKLRDGDRARENGDVPRAVLDYVQAYQLDPEDSRPRERIGFIQLTEDPQHAELTFSELAVDHPDSAVAYLGLGLAQLAQDHTEDARASLERSVELDDDSAVAQYALSVVREIQGDRDAAFESAERAYELDRRDSRIVANLGVFHMLRGEYEAAEKLLRRAILLSPRTVAHHNNLGLTLGLMKRYDEALATFEITGTEQSSHNNLGYVYFLNGEYDRAIAEYEIALLAEGDDEEEILGNLNRVFDVLDGQAKTPPATPVAVFQAIEPASIAQAHDAPEWLEGPAAERTMTAAMSTVHVVGPGENLYRLSQHYHVSVNAIRRANDIDDVTQIRVGQRLIIPGNAAAPTPVAESAAIEPEPASIAPMQAATELRTEGSAVPATTAAVGAAVGNAEQ